MDADGIRQLFADHDLRWTKQREEVYGALAASKAHPTAEELFNHVQAAHRAAGEGGMSLATVYNTLDALVRCGLARRFSAHAGGPAAAGTSETGGTGGAFRYDADVFDHAHVISPDGTIRDLPEDLSRRVLEAIPRDLVEQIERRLGVPIGRTSIEFVQANPPDVQA
jgi:Fur family peroxide stress response transcriptional regulator